MKRREEEVDQSVEQHLKLFSAPLMQEIDDAKERTRRRLTMQPVGEVEEMPAVSGFQRSAWMWRLGIAGAVAAAVLAVVFMPRGVDARATVEAADRGLSLDSGRILQAGEKLQDGEVVRANGSGAMLKLADGSHIEMRGQSKLSLERANDGIRIQLSNGDVIVNAAKQHGHLYVQTKDVKVSVVGTVFLVNADAEGSRVSVIEGEVRVQQGATEKNLRPGEQVNTNPLMELHPVSQEIAWSSRAPEHMALLQQSAVLPELREAFEVASIRMHPGTGGGGRGNAVLPSGFPPACGGSPPTIDPERFAVTNATLYRLITMAYGKFCGALEVSEFEILSGGPEWIRSDKFDIEAVIPKGSPTYTRQQLSVGDAPKLQMMLQNLLEERFKLVVGHKLMEMPAYLLMVGKSTPKLTPWKAEDGTGYVVNTGLNAAGQISTAIGGKKLSLADLAQQLMLVTRRPVLDRTGIKGEFTYSFEFAPNDDQTGVREMRADGRFPFLSGPPLITALEERLGLKLEERKEPVEVLVIDHVEKPSEN